MDDTFGAPSITHEKVSSSFPKGRCEPTVFLLRLVPLCCWMCLSNFSSLWSIRATERPNKQGFDFDLRKNWNNYSVGMFLFYLILPNLLLIFLNTSLGLVFKVWFCSWLLVQFYCTGCSVPWVLIYQPKAVGFETVSHSSVSDLSVSGRTQTLWYMDPVWCSFPFSLKSLEHLAVFYLTFPFICVCFCLHIGQWSCLFLEFFLM